MSSEPNTRGGCTRTTRGRWRLWAALACVAAVGCESEPAAPEPPAAPAPPTRPDEGPRGPAGADAIACEGASADPPQLELILEGAADGDVDGPLRALEGLAGAHPGSATARVRLGELSLRTDPPQAPTAARWFDRALALHEEGCTLPPGELWRALEGAALSRMMQGEYAAAAPFLERSLDRWPDVPATRYNLACVRCQTGAIDACAATLERLLAWSGTPPPFLGDQVRTREHYVRMARSDPDLAPLREDRSRFESLLAAPSEDAPAPSR